MNSRAKTFPLLIAFVLLFFLPHASSKEKNEALYEEAYKLYRQLSSDPKKARKKETWDLVGRTFYRIYSEDPDAKVAPKSLFIAAKVHEKKASRFNSPKDRETALRYSREFVRRYPKSSMADDSQLRAGRVLEQMGKKGLAYEAYRKILREMPKDDMYEIAEKSVKRLAKYKPKPAPKKAEKAPKGFATLKKIRHWSTDDYTRVVIETDREVKFSSRMLGSDPNLKTPPRLYVDLEKTVLDKAVNVEPVTRGLLEKIKFASNRPGVSRVVLYIKDFEGHKVFSLPKSKQNPHFRVVMDIEGTGSDPDRIFAKDPPSRGDGSRGEKKPVLESRIPEGSIGSLKQALGLKIRTVVIDPGHGGHDSGAVGPSGLKEKDVALEIAKRLRTKLLEEGKKFGIENVYLTRNSDRFIPLEERTAIAKKKKADIFISIHCNGHKTKKAHGIETYVLGFTDEQSSLQLAARENATTTKGLHALRTILKDYILSSKIEESQEVASHVQTSIIQRVSGKYRHVKNKGVKKAPFVVLIGADIPSVLVETSFITNPREEKRLKTRAYLERIVDGIVLGIEKYSKQSQKIS